jgi:hypothetical protein
MRLSWLLILVLHCFEGGRIDRDHLLRGPICPDGRDMDECADTAPCEPGARFEQLLVIVDTVLARWLDGIETGQPKRRLEAEDGWLVRVIMKPFLRIGTRLLPSFRAVPVSRR